MAASSGDYGNPEARALAKRSEDTRIMVHDSPSAAHLAGRTFRGLEPRVGETPVVAATQGRRGLAAGYVDEGCDEQRGAPRKEPSNA